MNNHRRFYLTSGCDVYGFMTGMNGTVSIMTLSAVAIDRFLVLSRPLDVNRRPTYRRIFASIVGVWLYSLFFAILPFVGIGKYVPEGFLTSCSYDYLDEGLINKIYILSFFVGAWVVPLAITAFCYIAIIRAVYQVRQNITGKEERPRSSKMSPLKSTRGRLDLLSVIDFLSA